MLCIDHLGAILVRLAPRRIESYRRAVDGTVRLLARGPTFESLLALAVDEIRQSAGANVGALTRVLAMLESVASCTPSPERRQLIAAHVAQVGDAIEADVPSPHDRSRLREQVARALDAARVGLGAPAAQTAVDGERVTSARPAPPRSLAG